MYRILILCALILASLLFPAPCPLLPAPCLHAAGTTTADFLKIAVGARPTGMGEAFVAVADETSGMFWNPAGLGFSLSPETQASHSLWLGDLYYSYAGYSQPTMSGTFGLAVQYLSGPSTPKIIDGVSSGDFQYYDSAANLLYAKRLNDTASAGLNLRYIQSQLDSNQASAFTGDLGILLRTRGEGFSFGVSGQNLFGTLAGEKLPLTGRAGMAFKTVLPEQASEILLSLEAGQTDSGPAYYAAGLEHWGAKTLGLRVGYKYVADEKQRQSLDALSPWRAGIGLRVRSVAMDYAYQPFAAVADATHRLTLTWRTFGWQSLWRMVSAQIKADPALFSPNGDGAKDSVFFVPQNVEVKDVKKWELQITDIDGNPMKLLAGKDVLPKIVTWEGQTDAGGQVSEGRYRYVFTVEGDGNKRAKSPAGEVTADLTPPAASLQISTGVFSPGAGNLGDKVTFYISVSDLYGIEQWQVSLLNERRKRIKVFKSTASVPVELQWDGRDDYYEAVVPNGSYEARLTAWDAAGNKSIVSLPLQVYVAPKVEIKEVVKELKVNEDKRGLVVNLSSQVLFSVGKAALRPVANGSLDEVVNLLQSYPENQVLIEGYTDSTGSRKRNIDISSERAWAVYSYLVKHGVEPSRLKPKGYGPDKPVASNRTAAGRAQNRRVAIIILKK